MRPEKASGTRWVDHKMRAIGKLNNKFDVYAAAHLGNVIANAMKQRNCASPQGKYNELIKANVFLRNASLPNLLLPA